MNRARHLFVSFFGKNLLLVFVSLILLPGSPSNRKEPALKISNTRLKELREERMLTQGELAELAGISLYTVHAAEHGRNVSPKTGRALSTALGVDPGELLPKAPAPPSSPEAPDASEEERRLAEEATGWAEGLAEELTSFAKKLAAK